jgi:hypothetical protein
MMRARRLFRMSFEDFKFWVAVISAFVFGCNNGGADGSR